MESGSNRLYTNSKIADNILNYLNNAQGVDFAALREEGIDRVADAIETSLDLKMLWPEFEL